MTTAEKPSGYFPDSLRREILGNSVSGGQKEDWGIDTSVLFT